MNDAPLILAIETSCDDCSVAVMRGRTVASHLISSQKEHTEWGGVVPELASRAHLRTIGGMVVEALRAASADSERLDAVAVTTEPGLIGSLLVGVNVAKGIAVARGVPLIAVNHIEAHLHSILLDHPTLEWPWLALVVSGGHTLIYACNAPGDYTLLGATRDDAAGEAFDKGAKLLGLGYPGGPVVDKLAVSGNREAVKFPRGLLSPDSLDFSFSGLKTSLRYHLRDHYNGAAPDGQALNDLCASYQEAIVETLVTKALRAAERTGLERIALVGGVAANSRLRALMEERCTRVGRTSYAVSPIHGTDNAAMIGLVGVTRFETGAFTPITVTARASAIRAPRQGGGSR